MHTTLERGAIIAPLQRRNTERTLSDKRNGERNMSKTVILSAARTPVGKFGGSLKDVKATELGGLQLKRRLKEQMFLLVMLRKLYSERLFKVDRDKFHHAKRRGLLESLGKCRRKQ